VNNVNGKTGTQVHESDTGPDWIWSDPTIRRNPIQFLGSDFFVGFRRTVRRNPILKVSSDSTIRIPIKSYKILSDFVGFRWFPMGSVLDPIGSVVRLMDLWYAYLLFHQYYSTDLLRYSFHNSTAYMDIFNSTMLFHTMTCFFYFILLLFDYIRSFVSYLLYSFLNHFV